MYVRPLFLKKVQHFFSNLKT